LLAAFGFPKNFPGLRDGVRTVRGASMVGMASGEGESPGFSIHGTVEIRRSLETNRLL
jgi:hypothetical protein